MFQDDLSEAQEASSGGPPIRRLPRPGLSMATFVIVIAGVVVAAGLTTKGFMSVINLDSIMTSAAFVGVIAIGATVITLSGNLFSMSLGITAAVAAIVFLAALKFGTVVAIIVSMMVGAGICAAQGWVTAAFEANPIIVTIGAGLIQEGFTLWATGGITVYPPVKASYGWITGRVTGVPVEFLFLLGTVIGVEFLLRWTRFGRGIYGVGENRRAARAAGLRVIGITTGTFAIAGACAGLGGVLLGAFNQSATMNLQGNYTFTSIAAVLVGGTLITGGRGSAVRTLFGALVVTMILSVLLLRGYSTGVQDLGEGILVLTVVVLVQVRGRWKQ